MDENVGDMNMFMVFLLRAVLGISNAEFLIGRLIRSVCDEPIATTASSE